MWFFEKTTRKQSAARFLRKAPLERKERRIVVETKKPFFSLGMVVLWGVFTATVIYSLLFSSFLVITKKTTDGVEKLSIEEVERVVDEELSGKQGYVFFKKNFILFDSQRLEERLIAEFPLIRTARVVKTFPDTLRIVIEEREKIFLWCSQEQCFVIDEQGKARDGEKTSDVRYEPFILSVTDLSARPITIGKEAVASDYVRFVRDFFVLFPQETGIFLESHCTTSSRFADEVRIKTKEGWSVYVRTKGAVTDALAVIQVLLEKELPAEKRERLEYIDARVENRLYYVLRDEGGEEEKIMPEIAETSSEEKSASKKKKK
ncbi:MAG: FtsQ-type POTRA domain-containing protein [Candidatus Moranbacteria bacterium]|nr:FtsQ-type POTRA domain-containing protein [Candidatus Moranbacteria bacterium]